MSHQCDEWQAGGQARKGGTNWKETRLMLNISEPLVSLSATDGKGTQAGGGAGG